MLGTQEGPFITIVKPDAAYLNLAVTAKRYRTWRQPCEAIAEKAFTLMT